MSSNFLETSTIHGFKYLARKYHCAERIFWTISLFTSAVCTSILIFELIVKIKNFPIVSYISDQSIPIEQVDYPAVTICSGLASAAVNLIEHDPLENFPYGSYEVHNLKINSFINNTFLTKLAEEDFKIVGKITYLKLLRKLSNFEVKVEDLNLRILKRLQVVDLVTREGIFRKLNISLSTDNFLFDYNYFEKLFTIHFHNWSGKNVEFSEILAEHGLCYTFNLAIADNMLHTDLVSADFYHEYYSRSDNVMYGRKIPRALNTEDSYEIKIRSTQAFYDINYFNLFEGHKVYIHSSYEHPIYSTYNFIMPKSGSSYLYFEPQLYVTDQSMYDMEPIDRNCYLENEKVLKFYKVYTKHNCEHECLADFVLQRCGCVEFFMIRNFATQICAAIEKECFDGARNDFEQHKGTCKCLQPCNYVKYYLELRPNFMARNYRDYDGYKYHSAINFHLVGPQIKQFIRKKQFNEVDFLSFAGGLLSLFAGFSALTFMEIIFWILRKVKHVILVRIKRRTKPKIIQMAFYRQSSNKPRTESPYINTKSKYFVQSYFSESSIHGLIYLTNSKNLKFLFWLLALAFSFSLCVALITETNLKVPDSRIISLDENIGSIGSIPFPAVTYSNFLFIDKYIFSSFYRFRKFPEQLIRLRSAFKKNPVVKRRFMKILLMFQMGQSTIGFPWEELGVDADNITEDILKESSNFYYFKKQFASFNGNLKLNLSEVHLKSSLGINFNLMDSSKLIRLDEVGDLVKYNRTIMLRSNINAQPIPSSSYPIHVNIKDRQSEFVLKINHAHPDRFNKMLLIYETPKVFIHPVDVYPNFIQHEIYVTPTHNTQIILDVTPEITRTDESLRHLDPKTRECYFENEKHLRFFKIYSEVNCRGECLTNVTFKTCGCVLETQIYSPKYGMKFCHKITEYKCAYFDVPLIYEAHKNNCFCLPSCNSITYNFKYSTQPSDEMEIATIIVRMSMENAILYRRYQQFTFSDVVSYVGGLLGLFAGISVLSLFEIFYYFTLRLICEISNEIRKQVRVNAIRN